LAARAKELYLRNCAICHTETGQGEGRFFASDLEPKPTDLTLQSTQTRNMDDLQRWIQEGSSGFGRSKLCPTWGQTMTAEDTAALARYVLSLRDAKPAPADS
jgi:mono/diheme cytochrome c family protein